MVESKGESEDGNFKLAEEEEDEEGLIRRLLIFVCAMRYLFVP